MDSFWERQPGGRATSRCDLSPGVPRADGRGGRLCAHVTLPGGSPVPVALAECADRATCHVALEWQGCHFPYLYPANRSLGFVLPLHSPPAARYHPFCACEEFPFRRVPPHPCTAYFGYLLSVGTFFFYNFFSPLINLFIFGCVGSSFLCEGFL